MDNNDFISKSTAPKRPVPIYDDGKVVGLREYKPYQTDDSAINRYGKEYKSALNKSITGEPVKKDKKKKEASESARKGVSRALALIMVFSAGAVAEKAQVPEMIEAGVHRVFDNDEMQKLADQFCEMFGVKTYPTKDHMHYFFGDEYIDNLKDIGPVTPNIIYAAYAATGSVDEAKKALSSVVNNGNFIGDPDDVKRVLSEPLEWEAKRHELSESFRDAGKDFDRFLDNEQAQVTVATMSARGGK